MVLQRPATDSPKSSIIPKFRAALNPISDHSKGIMSTGLGTFEDVQRSMPKVNMVVGQGKPKVGLWG
jgi:hypothetical protein